MAFIRSFTTLFTPFRNPTIIVQTRSATQTKSGAILAEPQRTPFGLIGLVCAVVPGLLIGAAISKNIANFLEENDLFVPSDDDDDDD
ncbi:essential MCU regulator, mitochondrial [Chrysoperla carnea]|uniref:essential MCU regulator, mitochondrial n=1 Tax=Chrysoperla carnea TaxID=189513 RepID=UPI001D05CDCE|nr:essential MCU regulator, mitochondrial [Chrysoperla carnea]